MDAADHHGAETTLVENLLLLPWHFWIARRPISVALRLSS